MKRVVVALFFAAVASSPLAAQKKIEQIAARVNEDIILKSEIDRELEVRRSDFKEQGLDGQRLEEALAEEAKTILRDLIDRQLLLQVAKEAGLSAELDVAKAMEELRVERKYATTEELEKAIAKEYGDLEEFKNRMRTKFLSDEVIQHEVYSRIVVTNEEMRKFYDEHNKEFDKPAGVRLSAIVVLIDKRLPDQVATQRKKIEEALAAVKKGDDFAEVAKKYSEIEGAQDGGDLGFITGEIDDAISKSIANLARNQTTDIVERNDAFEIYKVTDKHAGGILTFDLAQQYIWPQLMGQSAPPKVRDFLIKLRGDGFVDVKAGFVDAGAPSKTAGAAAAKP